MKLSEVLYNNDLKGLFFENGIICTYEEGHYGVPGGHYSYTDEYTIPQFEEEFDISWSEIEVDIPSKAEYEEEERRNAELENQMLEDFSN